MKLTGLLLTLFFSVLSVSAQTDSTARWTDTTDVENWESWGENGNHSFEFNVFDDEFRGAPTIYASFGMGKIKHKNIPYQFADPRSLEIKLGQTYQKDYKGYNKILKYRFTFLSLSNVTTGLTSDETVKLKSETWRFGAGRATGYGYKLGSAAFVPYYMHSLTWSRLDADDSYSKADSLSQYNIQRYNDSFRFANTVEGGIKIQFIPEIALNASYERTAVFERHLFWKWGGSILIEMVGQSLLDEFIEKIIDSSPYVGPVINFLLKNGLAYGMYELRKEKMNWPFDSAPALMYDQFKVGLTFVF